MITSVRSEPLVSVITPVHNGERFLEAALLSALAQECRDFEIIVLDDGSTDRSGEIARDYAAAHPKRVRYFEQARAGVCVARNAAIGRSRGRYLGLLDCDDLWMPQHLAQALSVLEAEPDTVMVHADIRFIEEDGRVSDVPSTIRPRWSQWAHDPFRAILLRHEHVACSATLLRKDLTVEIGGFDRRYTGLGCEDRDLWLRLALRGTLRYLNYHAADYRVHSGSVSRDRERMLRARRLLVERMCEFPQGRRLYAAACAAVALSEAEECSRDDERGTMALAYARAIRLNPGDWRGWRGLARALIPDWLYPQAS